MTQTLYCKIESVQAVAWLQRAYQQLTNMTPMMAEIAGVLGDEAERAFELQRDPTSGAPWQKLKQSTIDDRAKHGYWPGKILQRSGQLAASVVTDHGPDFALAGSNKVQAAIMQKGGKTKPHEIRPKNKKALAFGGKVVGKVNHPGSTIPARPFLGLSPEGDGEIVEIVKRHVMP